jgi:hypothetical protein
MYFFHEQFFISYMHQHGMEMTYMPYFIVVRYKNL